MKKNRYLKAIILYAILTLLCLIRIDTLYIFFLIFLALTALYIYLYIRHKDDKPSAVYSLLKRDKNKSSSHRNKNFDEYRAEFTKKELKKQYKDRMEQIERDFAFDDDFNSADNDSEE